MSGDTAIAFALLVSALVLVLAQPRATRARMLAALRRRDPDLPN